jgi:hypothetical protein
MKLRLSSVFYALIILLTSTLPLASFRILPKELLENISVQGLDLRSFAYVTALIGLIFAFIQLLKAVANDGSRFQFAAHIASSVFFLLVLLASVFSSSGFGLLTLTSTLGVVENSIIVHFGIFSILIFASLLASVTYSTYLCFFKEKNEPNESDPF